MGRNKRMGEVSTLNGWKEGPIVVARNLSRTFLLGGEPVQAIDDIGFEVAVGEFLVFKGKSGSGKSTLLSLLAGLDTATAGFLKVCGIVLQQLDPVKLARFRRMNIGMIFQSFNLLSTLTVLENIALPALLSGVGSASAYEKAGQLMELVELGQRARHKPSEISGGEMQRVAIARALINDPALLIADEPTGNLDSKTGRRILHFIQELNRTSGRTVIMATHSADADNMAHRILRLEDGRFSQRI